MFIFMQITQITFLKCTDIWFLFYVSHYCLSVVTVEATLMLMKTSFHSSMFYTSFYLYTQKTRDYLRWFQSAIQPSPMNFNTNQPGHRGTDSEPVTSFQCHYWLVSRRLLNMAQLHQAYITFRRGFLRASTLFGNFIQFWSLCKFPMHFNTSNTIIIRIQLFF